MLDLPENDQTPEATPQPEAKSQPDTKAPQRRTRRRAASRPAGPPPEVVADPADSTADPASTAPAEEDATNGIPNPFLEVPARREPVTGAATFTAEGLTRALADPFRAPESAPAVAETDEADTDETGTDETATDETETDTDETAVGSEDDAEQADDADTSDDAEQSDDSDDADDGGRRRRRRRRGGRRRRRGADSDEESDDSEQSDDSDASAATADRPGKGGATDSTESEGSGAGASESDSGEKSEGGSRRRRRRRRRGEDTGSSEDDPGDVVVRVREPRGRRAASDEVTGIDGSTRMEAKRQRRREGRSAGRRRPILSESEFLARRESVKRTMAIVQREDLSQIAVLEDGVLVEHYVDRQSATSLIGNVYLGRVQNVLPSMEAAFIDIGRGRNAVLYAGEINWGQFGAEGHGRKVENVLKSGQTVLVQVTKDPVGAKGARLTHHISLPGRYVVYSPSGHLSGISRKLPDTERKRLKGILSELIGDDASVIVRTAAEGASEDELVRDVNRLKAQWDDIEKKVKQGSAPQRLYGEPELTLRIVRDLFTEDFAELSIDGDGSSDDAHDAVKAYVEHVAPHLADRIRRWDREEQGDIFAVHRIDEQIAKALERKVFLPSGGSLVIDRTEAMTVIDVNTGKFTGSGGNLEATVTSNNLEAAEEIVRQLRLRDLGGIVVIDFIDMVLPSNRELLLRRLVECLGRDRTRHQVAEVTSLGLVQMTRKKIGTGLAEAFTEPCDCCCGRGYHIHDMPVDSQEQADGGERRKGKGRGGRRRGKDGGNTKDGSNTKDGGNGKEPGGEKQDASDGSADD